MKRTILPLLLALCAMANSACVAPIIVGGAAVVVADEIAEEERGGDGLF